jgi:hypothetical protein
MRQALFRENKTCCGIRIAPMLVNLKGIIGYLAHAIEFAAALIVAAAVLASVVTSKAAIDGHLKTGQRKQPEQVYL